MSLSAAGGLTCRGLSKSFRTRNASLPALVDVSFDVRSNEFVSVVGPSGCGKSTLLKILAGLSTLTSGEVVFQVPDASRRPRSSLVFQEHGLFPWMTVIDNVAFGLEMQGVARATRTVSARAFLDQLGLAAFADSYPHQLSVGMRQRAAIARAFLSNPHLLLMDEPLSALDAQSKLIVQEELLRIWREHQSMVVYVTHDIEEAILLGDRVLVMSGRPGRILEVIDIPLGRPRDLRDREQANVRSISWHIWEAIESEVRSTLRSSV